LTQDVSRISRRRFLAGTVAGVAVGAAAGATGGYLAAPNKSLTETSTEMQTTTAFSTETQTSTVPTTVTQTQTSTVPTTVTTTKTTTQTASTGAPEPVWNADVIVIGLGFGGLMAATFAADEGAKVLVLEKNKDNTGNDSYISSGTISGSATKMQLQQGITNDSPWEHYKDCLRVGHYKQTNDKALEMITEEATSLVDWLQGVAGVNFTHQAVFAPAHPYYKIPRSYWADPQGSISSGGVIAVADYAQLTLRVNRGSVKILFSTRATNLIVNNGVVQGVTATDSTGASKNYMGKAVVLATGHFLANPTLVKQYIPYKAVELTLVPAGDVGDGLVMATAVGAGVEGMEQTYNYGFPGAVIDPTKPTTLVTTGTMNQYPGVVWVNQNGVRFFAEDVPDQGDQRGLDQGDKIRAFGDQPGKACYVIMDSSLKPSAPPAFGTWSAWNTQVQAGNVVMSANTIQDLAGKLGINATALANTITKYNSYVAAGSDPDFGRLELVFQLQNPPYFGF